MLLDVNNSAQIPPDKRIDLSLDPPSEDDDLALSIDRPSTPPKSPQPGKSYKQLLAEVPHSGFATAAERFPELLADLEAGRDSPGDPLQGQPHPPTFLTADEIDNYIYEIDMHLASQRSNGASSSSPPPMLPTLAPIAHGHAGRSTTYTRRLNGHVGGGGGKDAAHTAPGSSSSSTARDFALRNPTSVYNWLRKHAPKTFLQDGEPHPDHGDDIGGGGGGGGGGGSGTAGGRDHDGGGGSGRATGRGSRGGRTGTGGERGSRGGAGGGSVRGKRPGVAAQRRAAAAAAAAATAAAGEPMDVDNDAEAVGTAGKGAKRKRVVDDDPGYRPKGGRSGGGGGGGSGGGASRPAKKKRKSEGGDVTPTAAGPGAKRSRKSGGGEKEREKERERERERDRERGEEKEKDDGRDAITAKGTVED